MRLQQGAGGVRGGDHRSPGWPKVKPHPWQPGDEAE